MDDGIENGSPDLNHNVNAGGFTRLQADAPRALDACHLPSKRRRTER